MLKIICHFDLVLQATTHLVNAIRGQADSYSDSDIQRRLLAAAKQLADATARMVEAAKVRRTIYLTRSCCHREYPAQRG